MSDNNQNNQNNKTGIFITVGVIVALIIAGTLYAMSMNNYNDSKSDSSSSSSSSSMMSQESVMVGGAAMFANKNLVENVVNAPNLTTLVAAVTAADLVSTLQGPGPFTVFGPTNDAFAKLPAGTVENLVKPENKAQLTEILTYHVVSGKFVAKDLTDGQMLKTVQGGNLTVIKSGNTVSLKDVSGVTVKIITPDVLQSNGVAHVIDTILTPTAN